MTAITMPIPPVKIALPTREELRDLMYTPSVIITMIVCGTLLALTAITSVVFLAYHGHDATVVGALVTAALVGIGGLMNSRIKRTLDAVKDQQAKE